MYIMRYVSFSFVYIEKQPSIGTILSSNADKTYLVKPLDCKKRGARIIVKRKIREISSEEFLKTKIAASYRKVF